jgi:hypothetical protein
MEEQQISQGIDFEHAIEEFDSKCKRSLPGVDSILRFHGQHVIQSRLIAMLTGL